MVLLWIVGMCSVRTAVAEMVYVCVGMLAALSARLINVCAAVHRAHTGNIAGMDKRLQVQVGCAGLFFAPC